MAKMAEFESDHGFTLPDVTKYPKGFVYIEETAGEVDAEVEAEEQTARVLDEAIDTHLSLVKSWWPIMEHLDQAMLTYAKDQAFAKHSVTEPGPKNLYFVHWTVANFRKQTWDLCEDIMDKYMKFELKGLKNPLATNVTKRKSTSESGPVKKKGKKATSNRQVIACLCFKSIFVNEVFFFFYSIC